jgi:hypothetical protein
MAGRFLWRCKGELRACCDSRDRSEQVTIEAEHDGYTRLPDPVTHRRTVDFDRGTGSVSIEDGLRVPAGMRSNCFFICTKKRLSSASAMVKLR